MKKKLLALALLVGGAAFAQTRFSVGVNVGGGGYNNGYQAAPQAYVAAQPPCPGPGYTWVDGYYTQNYGRRVWVAGYWNQPYAYSDRAYSNRAYSNRYDARDFHGDSDRGSYRNQNRGEDRGRVNDQGNRQNTGNGNGFRGRN